MFPMDRRRRCVNVVDYYKHLWKKFADLDPEDDYRPPVGQRKRADLVRAHDRYLKVFSERAEYLEPTWFNTAQSAAEHVTSPSLLFNQSTLEEAMKALMDALEPYAQEEVDRVLNSEVGSTVQPFVQEVNGKKIDVIAEGMKNRLKMDFIAGAQSFWQSRMLMQLQARQMLENLTVAADVNGLAEEMAKGDRLASKGKPLPAFDIRIIGPIDDEDSLEDNLKWEFDGGAKLTFRVGLKPLGELPDDLPEIVRELDFGPIQKVPASYRPYKNLAAGGFDYDAAQKDPSLWSDQVYVQELTARAKNKLTGAVLAERKDNIYVRLSPVGLEIEKDVYQVMTEEPVSIGLIPKTRPPQTHKLPRFEADFGDGKTGETLLVASLDHTYTKAGEYTVRVKYFATDMDGQRTPLLLGEASCKVMVRPRRLITVKRQNITGKDLDGMHCFSSFIGYSQKVNLTYSHEEGFPDRPHGKFSITFPDGTAKVDGSFVNGMQDGDLNEYFNNGKPYKQTTFKEGQITGKGTTWNFNGKIAFEYEADTNGQMKWTKSYYESGELKEHWEYSGPKTGHYRQYWGNGRVSVEYDAKDGTVVPGSTKLYDSNGNLTGTN